MTTLVLIGDQSFLLSRHAPGEFFHVTADTAAVITTSTNTYVTTTADTAAVITTTANTNVTTTADTAAVITTTTNTNVTTTADTKFTSIDSADDRDDAAIINTTLANNAVLFYP